MRQRLLALPLLLLLLAGCGSVATTSGAIAAGPTATALPGGAPGASAARGSSSRPTVIASGAPSPRPTTAGGAIPSVPGVPNVPGVPPGFAATATAIAAIPLPSSLPSSPPVGPPAKIGEPVIAGGAQLTLVSVQDNAPAGALPPNPGERRYIADLIVENIGNEPVLYSALFGTIVLADGTSVNITFDTEPTPQFSGGSLNPSESARGWLTFDLPQNAVPDLFVYDNLNGAVSYKLR